MRRFLTYYLLTLLPLFVHAQVSHPSGYYDGVDSIFFTVDWNVSSNQQLQWSVNEFTEKSFVPYTGGVWLKDRSYTPNTWENYYLQEVSDGSVSISFHGIGLDDISVSGMNVHTEGMKVRLVAVAHDVFDAYVYVPDGTLQIAESGITPKTDFPGPPHVFDSGDGWMITFGSGEGYTVGDYWEIVISKNGEIQSCGYSSDFTQPRGLLKKVNTVRVRLVNTVHQSVVKDSVYIIGFGTQPHGHHILFATADSSDVVEVLSAGSDDDIRRNVYLHIMDPLGKIEFAGKVEWDKAAGSSSCLPNTGVAFKARGSIGAKNMTSSIYGTPGEKIDKIKMRVGGSGQGGAFSSHEVAVQVLQTTNLELLGGVKNAIATWYLNGSYWSLGFPQEQPRKRFYGRVLGVDENEVEVVNPIPFDLYIDTFYFGYQDDDPGHFLLFDSISAKTLGLPVVNGLVFFPLSFVDIKEMVIATNKKDERKQVIANIQDGTGNIMRLNIEKILIENTNIQNHINIDAWSAYISIVHFLNMYDIVSNNNDLGITPTTQLFPVFTDFDGSGVWNGGNNWGHLFHEDVHNPNYKGIMRTILSLIHSSSFAMSRLALVYQDLLNTALVLERTTQIVRDMRDKVLPHYEEYHLSWGGSPNGGATLQQQEQLYAQMEAFYQ